MVFAQPHFIAHLTLTTFSHETVAIYNSYSYKTHNFFYNPIRHELKFNWDKFISNIIISRQEVKYVQEIFTKWVTPASS